MKTTFTHSDFELLPQYDNDQPTTVQEFAYACMPDELGPDWDNCFSTHITVDGVEYTCTKIDIDYPATRFAQYTNETHPGTVYELIS